MKVLSVSLTQKIASQAESYNGIRVGFARLEDILKGPSYQDTQTGPVINELLNYSQMVEWQAEAQTVMVLALEHPQNDPRLDYWERGDSWGNRKLRELSELLKQWLLKEYNLSSLPLPYQKKRGGLFLKDAAVISGIGMIGKNNLLLNPEWGPRIRLRSILLEGQWQPTPPLDGFNPCESCEGYCQKACPQNAFPHGKYNRQICSKQMHEDEKNKTFLGRLKADGKRDFVIKYCRACELSCPIGSNN
jgi:epoxyqueuosine reductase